MNFDEIIPYVRDLKLKRGEYSYQDKFALDSQLIYVHDGSVCIEIDESSYVMTRGSVALVQCGSIHSLKTTSQSCVSFVHFDYTDKEKKTKSYPLSLMNADSFMQKKLISPPEFEDTAVLNSNIFLDNMNILEHEIFKMHAAFHEKHVLYISKLSAVLKSVLVDIVCTSNERGVSDIQHTNERITELVIDYINENYTDSVSSKSLSRIFKYSPNYLNSVVKKKTGYSICRYVIICRLSRAMYLLNTTDKTISEIAVESGFDEGSSFSRAFKNNIGISPANYRGVSQDGAT